MANLSTDTLVHMAETPTPTHEFNNTDSAIDAIVEANTLANNRYPQMFGPKTLITGGALLSNLTECKITAGKFMSYRLHDEMVARQLESVNKTHAAYGQYQLGSHHISYTWEKDQYDTLRALQLFIPKSYARSTQSSTSYIDKPQNSPFLQRISNLFHAGSQALEKSAALEMAKAYRETLRDFQKRKYEKQHEWSDEEKEELGENWGNFSDYLRDVLTSAITESNSRLDKPFNGDVISPFLQEIANRGTRVVARIKHSMY